MPNLSYKILQPQTEECKAILWSALTGQLLVVRLVVAGGGGGEGGADGVFI